MHRHFSVFQLTNGVILIYACWHNLFIFVHSVQTCANLVKVKKTHRIKITLSIAHIFFKLCVYVLHNTLLAKLCYLRDIHVNAKLGATQQVQNIRNAEFKDAGSYSRRMRFNIYKTVVRF